MSGSVYVTQQPVRVHMLSSSFSIRAEGARSKCQSCASIWCVHCNWLVCSIVSICCKRFCEMCFVRFFMSLFASFEICRLIITEKQMNSKLLKKVHMQDKKEHNTHAPLVGLVSTINKNQLFGRVEIHSMLQVCSIWEHRLQLLE